MTTINMMDAAREEKLNNIFELKGLLADAKRRKLKAVIIPVPVHLMVIDTGYQTPVRTERELNYLTRNWDERKIGVLMGVPHYEEGKIYLVDGYGRMTASQIVDAEKYSELDTYIILDAPEDKTERRIFEAELFSSQGNNKVVTPFQKHGARQIVGDPVVKSMDLLQSEYGFEYSSVRGKRGEGVIGSYSELYKNIKTYGYLFGEFFFDICKASGFNRKVDGYAVYVMRSIKDLYKLYPENRTEIKEFLSTWMRPLDYRYLHSKSNAKYELLGPGNAMTMYFEDIVVEGLGLDHKRVVSENKIYEKKTA